MGSRKRRFISLLIPLAGVLIVAGVIAPFASAVEFSASFTVNPTDALKNKVITSTPLSENGDNVQVLVTSSDLETSTAGLTVTLEFAEGSATTESITGNVETTNSDGYATFANLKIGDTNEETLTDYQFEAVVSGGASTSSSAPPLGAAFASEGAFSDPFDIWEAGCKGTGNGCTIGLRGGLESYKSSGSVVLTASTLSSGDLPNLDCPGQRLIFGDDIFTHATSGSGAVAVTSTITKTDFRNAGTNFGQAHVEWCVGIKPGSPGLNNGGVYEQQDTNGDGTDDLFVGFAPRCPKKKVMPPCIVSQVSDGKGGSITKGFLEGGDPPRRT
jgi:hypothetical protein